MSDEGNEETCYSHHMLASLPFSPTVLSQQVIKRWEERGTVKKRKEGSNIDESLPFHTLFLDSSSFS